MWQSDMLKRKQKELRKRENEENQAQKYPARKIVHQNRKSKRVCDDQPSVAPTYTSDQSDVNNVDEELQQLIDQSTLR